MKRIIAFVLTMVLILSVGTSCLVFAENSIPETGEYGVDWWYYGDVDSDQVINAKDALAVLKYAVGKQNFTVEQAEVADVTDDDVVNAKDALDILKLSVGKIPSFTVGNVYQVSVQPENPENPEKPEYVLDTTNSFNGAYELDETADNSFVMDNTGLEPNTVYLIASACSKIMGADGKQNDTDSFNMKRLIISLQGLINRDFGKDENHRSIVYLEGDSSDPDWLSEMLKDGAFKDFNKRKVMTQDDFFKTFSHQLKHCGFILWDQNVPATANVAATICGLDGYLPVLSQSRLATQLRILGVPQKVNLTGMFKNNVPGKIKGTDIESTGSAKNDAYLWALDKYGNRCSAKYIAYTLDGSAALPGVKFNGKDFSHGQNGLHNHDYLIARRCFFYDLAPYTGDAACDDPAAKVGLDAATLRKILQKRYDRAGGEIGMNMGFPPWWCKYNTDYGGGNLTPGVLEPYFAELVTCYNLAMEADAAPDSQMTNGSAYYKYVPLVTKYENTRPAEKMTYDNSKYYFIVYVGDYDSSAWMKRWVHSMWMLRGGDRKLGKVNMMWSYNPNLAYRIPMAFDYIYQNKTDKDYFAAGDSGAGYVNPTAFYPGVTLSQSKETRPASTGNGSAKWTAYCKKFYEKFDLDITGFIINTGNPFDKKIMDMYNQISPVGSTYYNGNDNHLLINNGVPYIQTRIGVGKEKCEIEREIDGKKVKVEIPTAEYLYDWQMNNMHGFHFASYRTVTWTPSEVDKVVNSYISYAAGKGKTVEYVDPYNFFDMIRQSGQGYVQ